jgi:hypothetical protein
VGLERGPISLVITTVEVLGKKRSDSALENREHGCRDPSSCPHGTLYPQKLPLTSPTRGVPLVGIVHLQTQATQFFNSKYFSVISYGSP